jgi:hypothetical protein
VLAGVENDNTPTGYQATVSYQAARRKTRPSVEPFSLVI